MLKNSYIEKIKRKKIKILLIIGCISIIVSVLLKIFNKNISLFLRPEEVYFSIDNLQNKTIRIGGMVRNGSFQLKGEQLYFIIDDVFENKKVNNKFPIEISFSGTLPSLFREGQMAIVKGKVKEQSQNIISFDATEVLAKHDERYYPR